MLNLLAVIAVEEVALYFQRYNGIVSEADRIKEVVGCLKIVFAALVAVDVPLIAWLAQNYRAADLVLIA